MKKRVIAVFFIFLFFILINFVQASFGVSPGKYVVDFSPGLNQNFTFKFKFDRGAEVDVFASGELKDYVILNTNELIEGGIVEVEINLPQHIETPGINNIYIEAKQRPSSQGGITLAGHVIARIEVKVPYPGKYAEIKLIAPNANAGELVNFTVLIDNLGTDTILAQTTLKIFDYQNITKDDINAGVDVINPKSSVARIVSVSTEKYKPGTYKAIALVDFGGIEPIKDEKQFRLGELLVNITNHSREFVRNKINKMDIEVESLWNDPVYNLYAQVSLINYDISFVTPSISLYPWSKNTLTGFFDTTDIKENKFKANITLVYNEKSSSKIVNLSFDKTVNYTLYIVIGIILLILILLIVIVFLIIKLKKKRK